MNTTFKDILTEDYKGNVITKQLPKELDNALFTLIHILGGFDTSDVINFARNANHREKRLLNKMVNDLRLYDNVGVRGFDKESIKNSSRYRALTIFLKTIADTGGADSLMEQKSPTDPYFDEYVKPEYKDYIFKRWDMDVTYTNCYVKWRYDMDVRSWGIKDVSVFTTSVIINAMVEIYDEDYTKVEVEKEIELMVDDMGGFSSDEEGKWHYEDQMSDELFSHSVFPTGLEIDFSDKTVHVLWN